MSVDKQPIKADRWIDIDRLVTSTVNEHAPAFDRSVVLSLSVSRSFVACVCVSISVFVPVSLDGSCEEKEKMSSSLSAESNSIAWHLLEQTKINDHRDFSQIDERQEKTASTKIDHLYPLRTYSSDKTRPAASSNECETSNEIESKKRKDVRWKVTALTAIIARLFKKTTKLNLSIRIGFSFSACCASTSSEEPSGFPNLANMTFANWTLANGESQENIRRKYSGHSPIGESIEYELAKVQWTLTNWPNSSDVLAEMQWAFANCHGMVWVYHGLTIGIVREFLVRIG